ncbi:MAG: hypothetical protein AAF682_19090 [Planctomycetota bacterium]
MSRFLWTLPALLSAFLTAPAGAPSDEQREVRGVTISCQGWGEEWSYPELEGELDDLQALGANWIAIHPYAWIQNDGEVRIWPELDPEEPPEWISKPIAAAHARGMSILIKPHLGYWGSRFSWRGEIGFETDEETERFFHDYRAWLLTVARLSRGADAFAVGTELELLIHHEERWRSLIAEVREVFPGHLTYAANWPDVEKVPFWDALDTVGVQGYYPLSDAAEPTDDELQAGWDAVVKRLRAVHEATGKPVVLTELGYSRALGAASEPWKPDVAAESDRERAEALQRRCFATAFRTLKRERDWLRGAFLWKWFVGESRARDFALKEPAIKAEVRGAWVDE